MKTLDELDERVADVMDEAPDGRRWFDRPRRRRRRVMAACVLMMPAAPSDDPEEREAWCERAEEKCKSVILMFIATAILTWLIHRLCDWLYERWKERRNENAEWSALRTESCLLLQQEEE